MTLSKDHDLPFGLGQQLCEISIRSDMGPRKMCTDGQTNRQANILQKLNSRFYLNFFVKYIYFNSLFIESELEK